MASRFSPGDLLALGAVSITGGALAASLAWVHMHAFQVVCGDVCGSDAGLLTHCPACYAAAALLVLGLTFVALAQAAPRRPLPARA
jgi:hypothetical protein